MYQNKKRYLEERPGKGVCVFAGEFIKEGEVIEESPICILSKAEGMLIHENIPGLAKYLFRWNKDQEESYTAVVFGSASFYNHSPEPNVSLQRDFEGKVLRILAKRDIKADEELSFDYAIPISFEVIL